eukprot:TRINITY_DN4574_c0_g1_i2.p1 TRINITY_DN4574_c0_g1~~TRINITY_DN4574_c0_g1_i2.p1  ORF type:complete len:842 (+),score=198.20 TRINITY_DN4574_c0_g1_i2:126-2651(+)
MAVPGAIGRVKALYDAPADPNTNTPQLTKDEILTLVKRHDNGWLEVYTSVNVHGFVPPAWVEDVADDPVERDLTPPPPPEDVSMPSSAARTPSTTSIASTAVDNSVAEPAQPGQATTPSSTAALDKRASMAEIAASRAAPVPQPPSRTTSNDAVAMPPQAPVRSPSRESAASAASSTRTSTSAEPTHLSPGQPGPSAHPRSPKPAPKAQPRPPVRQANTVLTYANPAAAPQAEDETAPAADAFAEDVAEHQPVEEDDAIVDDGPVAPPTRAAPTPQTTESVEPGAAASDDVPLRSKSNGSAANDAPGSGSPAPLQSGGDDGTPSPAKTKPTPRPRSQMINAFASQLEATLSGPVKPRLNKGHLSTGEAPSPEPDAGDEHARPHRPAPAPPPGAVPVRDRAATAGRKKKHATLAELPPEPKSPPPKPRRTSRLSSTTEPAERSSPLGSPKASRGVVAEAMDEMYEDESDGPPAEEELDDAPIDTSGIAGPVTDGNNHPVLHFGLLERKPVREGGKEARSRRWTKFFGVVNQGHLELFYSKKDYDKGKKPAQTYPIAAMEVTTEAHAKRKEVILFGNDIEKMLLSCPEAEVAGWLAALSPTTSSESMRNRRQTTPQGKEKVKSRLNRWLAGRAKKADLVEKGILQDTLFGGTIAKAVELEASAASVPNVPIIVVKCIERVDANVNEQGVYRVSGNASDIQVQVAEANKDVTQVDILGVSDVHVASGLLKLYFRELDEPAFTDKLYQSFIDAGRNQDGEAQEASLKKLCKQLPSCHRATLKYLFAHLQRVAALGDTNKMHYNNLGIVFGPTLLRESTPSVDSIVMDAPYQSSVVETLMQNPEWL